MLGTVLVGLAAFASMLCFFLEDYGLCFLVGVLWGVAEIFLMTNTAALVGKVFPGKVEAYSVFYVGFSFGTMTTVILNIALETF